MSHHNDHDKNFELDKKRTFAGLVGLGGIAPRSLERVARFTFENVKDFKQTELGKEMAVCPACCRSHLKTSKDEDGRFVGYACHACGLWIKTQTEHTQELHDFLKDNGRHLYTTYGGQQLHMNHSQSVINFDVRLSRIWAIGVLTGLCFIVYSAIVGNIFATLCWFVVLSVMAMFSISNAYSAYLVSNGLMYINNKDVFYDWLGKVHVLWWQSPIKSVANYDD